MILKTKKLLECIVFRPNSASDEKLFASCLGAISVQKLTVTQIVGKSASLIFFIRILRKQFSVRNLKKMCRGVYRPIYLAVRQKFEKNIAVVFRPTFDKRGSWSFTSEV